MAFFATARDRKLVVLGIPWDVDSDGLKEYMSKFGEVSDAIVMKDRTTGRSRGFGYVTFSSAEDALKVTSMQHVLNGRTLDVKIATPKEEMGSSSTKNVSRIFVARIPQTVTDDMFRSYFAKYGLIRDAYMPKEHGTRLHRGIGFVTFEDAGSVDNLMNETHELGGSLIAVDRAAPKEDTSKIWSKALSEGYLSLYNAYVNAAAQFGSFGTAASGSYNISGSEFSNAIGPSNAEGTDASNPGGSYGAQNSWSENEQYVKSADVAGDSVALKSGGAEPPNSTWGVNDGFIASSSHSASVVTSSVGQATPTMHSSHYGAYTDASHTTRALEGPGGDASSNLWASNCGNPGVYSSSSAVMTSSDGYTIAAGHSNFSYGEHARNLQVPDNSWTPTGGSGDVSALSWAPNSGFMGSHHSVAATASSAGQNTSVVHSSGYGEYARDADAAYNNWLHDNETNTVSNAWALNGRNFVVASHSAPVMTSSTWHATSSTQNFSYGAQARGTVVPDSSWAPKSEITDMSSNAYAGVMDGSSHSAALVTSSLHSSNYGEYLKTTEVPGNLWAPGSGNSANMWTLNGGMSEVRPHSAVMTSSSGHAVTSYANYGEHIASAAVSADSWPPKYAGIDASGKPWSANTGIVEGASQSAAAMTSYAEHTNTVYSNSSPSPVIGNKIFIARLPIEATAEHLRTYFSKFGRILDVYIPKDATKKAHRGFGFVTFFDDGVAERVALESHEILGQSIAVDRPTPQDGIGSKSQFANSLSIRSATTPAGSDEGSTGMRYGTLQSNASYDMWGSYDGTGVGPSNLSGSRMDFRYRPY